MTAPSSSKCLAQYVHALETEPQEDFGERFDNSGQISSKTDSCADLPDLSALSASFASFQLYAVRFHTHSKHLHTNFLKQEESDVGLGIPASMYEPLETASMMEWRMRS